MILSVYYSKKFIAYVYYIDTISYLMYSVLVSLYKLIVIRSYYCVLQERKHAPKDKQNATHPRGGKRRERKTEAMMYGSQSLPASPASASCSTTKTSIFLRSACPLDHFKEFPYILLHATSPIQQPASLLCLYSLTESTKTFVSASSPSPSSHIS